MRILLWIGGGSFAVFVLAAIFRKWDQYFDRKFNEEWEAGRRSIRNIPVYKKEDDDEHRTRGI